MTAGPSTTTPPTGSHALLDLIYSQLHDHGAGASIGCLGAIAEFHEPEAKYERHAQRLTATSARGALAVELRGDEVACAYEAPSAHGDAWQYGIALLAPGRHGAARTALTEIGADERALKEQEQGWALFDLGLAVPNVDYCVRTANAELIDALRDHCGTSVVTAGHALQRVLIDASPTRVVMSPLARIEVYQPIARDHTPQGSHTHLLPDLLHRRRTHAANLPLPPQALPLMTLHPENPLFDDAGQRRSFDEDAYQRFETLLARHGLPDYVSAKHELRAALAAGSPHPRPRTRIARAALRAALRQSHYVNQAREDVARG
ncbi:MAG: hypothetical protein IT492_07495 [Gammaproteobacteria bacterium]|nr:hypothetical protein [Gammaproteobacteria bacterium]